MNIEDHFITHDIAGDNSAVVFNLIESEDGGTYWGYGHVEPEKFITEVNNYLIHVGLDDNELVPAETKVSHLWVTANDEFGDFELVPPQESFIPPEAFPVTRLWL